jgi:hypothetical protein
MFSLSAHRLLKARWWLDFEHPSEPPDIRFES